jgi:hypothetical protein
MKGVTTGVVLVISITTALFFPSQAAAQGVAAAIDSEYPWQYSNAYVQAGGSFTVRTDDSGPDGKAGTWTVGYPGLPAVGPNGYDRATDSEIYVGCKYDANLPYGRLLGRVGDDGPVFSIGAGGTFQANASGPLNLRINDQDHCLVDNRGYIEVWVS